MGPHKLLYQEQRTGSIWLQYIMLRVSMCMSS